MKKMIAVSAFILLLLTGISAFTATSGTVKMAAGLTNGIICFEMGQNAQCDSAVPTVTTPQANGITYFNVSAPNSGANGACAGDRGSKNAKKWFANGIMIFG
jgi:hypothetical protein